MKYYLLVIFFVQHLNLCFSQTPQWAWANSPFNCRLQQVTTDINGNVFFSGTTYGGAILGNDTIPGIGILIVKYDINRNLLWTKVENVVRMNTTCLTTDVWGNLYLGGNFMGDSATGLLIIGLDTLYNSGSAMHNTDFILIKYDANGNRQWVRNAEGFMSESAVSITTDNTGNVYAAGIFTSDSISFGPNTILNAGYYDFFVVKYDSSGNVIWSRDGGGSGYDEVRSIASDASGNIYVTGFFYGSSLTVDSITMYSTGGDEIFFVKYDTYGNVLWAKRVGGTDNDESSCVSVDRLGNVYLGGYFDSSPLIFGSYNLNPFNNYCNDLFLAKYDPAGNVIWAKSAGGDICDEILNMSCDSIGNVYISGQSSSLELIFGTDTLGSSNHEFVFIVKYDSNGKFFWSKQIGDSGHIHTGRNSITTDPFGNSYVIADFQGCSFLILDSFMINRTNSITPFYGKLNASPPVGIKELKITNRAIIFPNPTTLQTSIDFNIEQKNTEISITDISGKEINKIIFSGINYNLDCTQLRSGIYLLKIEDMFKNILVKKLVIL